MGYCYTAAAQLPSQSAKDEGRARGGTKRGTAMLCRCSSTTLGCAEGGVGWGVVNGWMATAHLLCKAVERTLRILPTPPHPTQLHTRLLHAAAVLLREVVERVLPEVLFPHPHPTPQTYALTRAPHPTPPQPAPTCCVQSPSCRAK